MRALIFTWAEMRESTKKCTSLMRDEWDMACLQYNRVVKTICWFYVVGVDCPLILINQCRSEHIFSITIAVKLRHPTSLASNDHTGYYIIAHIQITPHTDIFHYTTSLCLLCKYNNMFSFTICIQPVEKTYIYNLFDVYVKNFNQDHTSKQQHAQSQPLNIPAHALSPQRNSSTVN